MKGKNMERYNVLLVDDEENILKSLQRSIIKFPFNLITAANGTEALEKLMQYKHEGFALIISDQRMPGMNGLEFLRRSRQIIPDTSRIMLTGYTDLNTAIEAINTGSVDYFLTKPWNETGLHNVINKMIEKYELISKNRKLNDLVKQQNASLKKLNEELEAMVNDRTREIERQKNDLKQLNQNLVEKNNSLLKIYNRLENSYVGTVKIFIKMLELRDPIIANHCKRVAVRVLEVTKKMNFSEQEIFDVEIAGLLHDIGKIGLSNDILIKKLESCSEDEVKLYRQHPMWGKQLISDVERLQPIGQIIQYHHENFDGTGYPQGLKAQEIPLGARIVSLCDFCDNAINRRATDTNSNLGDYLKRMAGTLFDPKIVDIYLDISPEKELNQSI